MDSPAYTKAQRSDPTPPLENWDVKNAICLRHKNVQKRRLLPFFSLIVYKTNIRFQIPRVKTQCLILITQSAFFCPLLNYFPTILCTMGLTIIEYYDKIIFCAAPPSPLSVSDRWVVGGDGS